MFVEGFRLFVALLGTGIGLGVGQRMVDSGGQPRQVMVLGVLGCLVGYVVGGVAGRLTDRALHIVEVRSRRIPPSHILAGGLGGGAGMVAGLTVAIPLSQVFPTVPGYMGGAIALWISGFLGVRLMIGRSDELLAMAAMSTRPLLRASAATLRGVHGELGADHASGEEIRVWLEKPGKEPGQGVGYLEDGTMVVVNGASDRVGGGEVAVVVTNLVPTDKGCIAFARLVEHDERVATP